METGVASDIQTREVKRKNPKPCSRCSDMRKKCDTSPPYSLARCRECTRANIPTCPPHRPRRSKGSSHPSISPNVASPNLPGSIDTSATPIGFTITEAGSGYTQESLFRLNELESEVVTDFWNLMLPTLLAPAFGPAYLPTQ
ncbi:uncharacterized protein FOMMEDRAFT_32416 [Fomitiporia mediterranea MF3/22]|uniref:Zn(2)-C6 fungal-type domain-containing protein n=1 Tax=Fomitiporia mediterranea (strain MF3/22) TaxID=694068 RepID=R7SGV6_FOMME|nr:uncharacterized protein FOMMEDRAFT_32416 [Fomitiporia mediterranea MF3/22]EJC97645.1 hypothetical protein FOMMEDRAFT_32416 [Fomitiporia mediterranea MF3/22]